MRIYLSIKPRLIGGGSNTFSWNFKRQAKKVGHRIVTHIRKADYAIIIAHLASEAELIAARQRGCRIVHRLDEYFEKKESAVRREKHQQIIDLNRYTDVTVFQSRYVYNNVYPVLQPQNCCIIHNGGDPRKFYPAPGPGRYIGHVTWGVDTKKRLDLLHAFICANPAKRFLLVGRHRESQYDFNLPNVKLVGKVRRWRLPGFFRQMKYLYFPSENDPCPNTVVEAILSGVPVCYNRTGGAIELVTGRGNETGPAVKDSSAAADTVGICGYPLERVEEMESDYSRLRQNCLKRMDLHFSKTLSDYVALMET